MYLGTISLHGKSAVHSNYPIAVEFGFVTAILVGVYLWQRVMRVITESLSSVLGSLSAFGGLPVSALVTGGLFTIGLVLFAGAYTASRDIDAGLALPSRTDVTLIGLAGVTPVVLVGFTKLVGTLTSVPYSSLTMTYYGADAPITPILMMTGLAILVGIPSLVLICQVLIQGSFKQALGGDRAVVLTTLVTGFVMMSHSGLATVPDRGKLFGTALFALVLGITLYVTERSTRERIRYLAYLPVLLFVALVVFSGVTEIESLADGLFTITHLAVLGIAAYTYERSDSLLVPAFAHLSISLANDAVVFVFEVGMKFW